MPLPDKRDHHITLAEASELTRQHRKDDPNAVHGEFFHRDAFETLLAQPGCAGIRIYHGKGKKGEHHAVMVAVDSKGADMTTSAVMQNAWPCPPYCDPESPLVR